jgi:hypothetical protein
MGDGVLGNKEIIRILFARMDTQSDFRHNGEFSVCPSCAEYNFFAFISVLAVPAKKLLVAGRRHPFGRWPPHSTLTD